MTWVAARLAVTPRMVRRLVQNRRIQHYKVSGRIRFDPADVERFIEESRRPSVNEGATSGRPSASSSPLSRPRCAS
ncbi:MAG: helix-turn-helix domain-containing protein [Acidimicrobiia bacterium]